MFSRNNKLKPCPFCGNKYILIETYDHPAGKRVRVVCPTCMAMIDAGWWQTEDPAINAWNRRVTE